MLAIQQENAWRQLSSQAEIYTRQLSEQQLLQLQQAVAVSDFVLKTAQQYPERLIALFSRGDLYQQQTPNYDLLLAQALENCQCEAELQRELRQFRRQHLAGIAIGDLVLEMPLASSLAKLSALADALIDAARQWLTGFCQQQWGTPVNKEGKEQPLLVYAMGKLGGQELNFSSDIDLIFAYPEAGSTQGARRSMENQQFFTRLAQRLISALNDITVDGFVYRVDMRLRPFGESGPLVMSFNAMECYYQEQGRDWERYAMLKARLIGSGEYHQQLSTMLRPFVYRRYIDFSVIDSLRRMKMLIAQEVRRKNLIDNIKLGAGGIREIEFIVQVFQLLRGGAIPELQQRNLLQVLPMLVQYQVISRDSELVLQRAYQFLRRVENIIQALDDQQTQTLPDKALDRVRLLSVLQFDSWQDFNDALQQHMAAVHREFVLLIGEESPHHQGHEELWSPLWQSSWSDQEAMEWLAQSAEAWQAELIWPQLAQFKQDVNKRSIGHRGRGILDKLMPLLLWHLYQAQYAEHTLARVCNVLGKIITRTAYLELLYENEGALKHLLRLCQDSAWVAEHIAKYPMLLDELIDPSLLNAPPSLDSYAAELQQLMLRIPEDDLEGQMNCLRQFKQAQHLRIAAADIVGVLALTKVSDHLTAVAEATIEQVVNIAWQQIGARYGVPLSTLATDDKGFAVIGYGKLGGIELGYASDLDLVFLHQSDGSDMTSGSKSISAGQFYIKLVQRMMHIFNTLMASGTLYELDTRLRPSGNAGLLVVHVDTFAQYQRNDAWTWEHQALVRARAVYGNTRLVTAFNETREQILTMVRELPPLKEQVITMRDKMRAHLDGSDEHSFDIKQGAGGLVDIEFICQYLVLLHGHEYPMLAKYSDNLRILEQLSLCGVLREAEAHLLSSSYCQMRDFGHRRTLAGLSGHLLARDTLAGIKLDEIQQLWQRVFA